MNISECLRTEYEVMQDVFGAPNLLNVLVDIDNPNGTLKLDIYKISINTIAVTGCIVFTRLLAPVYIAPANVPTIEVICRLSLHFFAIESFCLFQRNVFLNLNVFLLHSSPILLKITIEFAPALVHDGRV